MKKNTEKTEKKLLVTTQLKADSMKNYIMKGETTVISGNPILFLKLTVVAKYIKRMLIIVWFISSERRLCKKRDLCHKIFQPLKKSL